MVFSRKSRLKFMRAIELLISADLWPAITLARINIFHEVKSSWQISLSSLRKHYKINFHDWPYVGPLAPLKFCILLPLEPEGSKWQGVLISPSSLLVGWKQVSIVKQTGMICMPFYRSKLNFFISSAQALRSENWIKQGLSIDIGSIWYLYS